MFFLEIAFDQRAVGLGGAQIGADIADHLLAVEGSGAAHGVGFDVLVEAFVGIEFGAVTWQEIDPQRCPMTFAPTDGRPRQRHRMAVEDEEDFPSPILAQESAQKLQEDRHSEAMLEHHELQMSPVGDGRNEVAAKPLARPQNHRRLAARAERATGGMVAAQPPLEYSPK